MEFQEFDSDQHRETINTQQRYAAYREAEDRAKSYRGSTVWTKIKARDYLVRSYYDASGVRGQTSIGPRSKETASIKLEYERGRSEAQVRLKNLKAVTARQSAINRAIGLGRVPLIGAKIIRALDHVGMVGSRIRVLGTNAIYAYDATACVRVHPGLTTIEVFDAQALALETSRWQAPQTAAAVCSSSTRQSPAVSPSLTRSVTSRLAH
jgi:hypothetical protein